MKVYKCLIVDDEALAQDLVEAHLSKIPNTEVVAKCHTAMEAIKVMNEQKVDILFLDIEMPDLTGMDLLRSMQQKPFTILTTAYSEYALESYELNVTDYLLKPIKFDRFFKAITKVLTLAEEKESAYESKEKEVQEDFIFVKSDYKAVKIELAKIVFIEGMQKHVQFHLIDKKVTSLMSLKSLEDVLPTAQFFRCQKSFIVNLNTIESIDGNLLYLNSGDKIPMSKTLRNDLLKRIDKNELL